MMWRFVETVTQSRRQRCVPAYPLLGIPGNGWNSDYVVGWKACAGGNLTYAAHHWSLPGVGKKYLVSYDLPNRFQWLRIPRGSLWERLCSA